MKIQSYGYPKLSPCVLDTQYRLSKNKKKCSVDHYDHWTYPKKKKTYPTVSKYIIKYCYALRESILFTLNKGEC